MQTCYVGIQPTRSAMRVRAFIPVACTALLFAFTSCTSPPSFDAQGSWAVTFDSLRGADSGVLDIAGDSDDLLGRLVIDRTPPRIYALRYESASADSIVFSLSGGGRFILASDTSGWQGHFTYFGIDTSLKAERTGPPDPGLEELASPSPISPGVVSTGADETFPTLSPDGQVMYFSREGVILRSARIDEQFGAPDTVSFSGVFQDSAPYLSSDGSRMLFTSRRPNPEAPLPEGQRVRQNIWSVDAVEGGWGIPRPLPSPVNVDTLGDYHAAMADDGSLIFVSFNREGGFGRSDLYAAEPSEGQWAVSNLGRDINSEASEADLYLDPQKRFMIMVSTDRDDSFGADDLYLSVRSGDGGWEAPINLGMAVNSFAYEYRPWIDEASEALFFVSFRRGTGDLYKVPIADIPLLLPFFSP